MSELNEDLNLQGYKKYHAEGVAALLSELSEPKRAKRAKHRRIHTNTNDVPNTGQVSEKK